MGKPPSDRSRPRAGAEDHAIGEQVRARRLVVGLTQEKLGDALGVTFQQVQKYEKGANRISASRLRQIATALDVPITRFYDGGGVVDGVDGAVSDPAHVREDAQLLRAFGRIGDPLVRQRLIALVESLASKV